MDLMLLTTKGVIPSLRAMFDAMSRGTLTFSQAAGLGRSAVVGIKCGAKGDATWILGQSS